MKARIILSVVSIFCTLPVLAGNGDSMGRVPEPSTIGLFIAAAIAITLLAKYRK